MTTTVSALDLPLSPDDDLAVDLRIEVVPDRRRVFLTLIGELDLATVPAVEEQLRELRAVGFEELVLDLRSLSFMDSSGLALVVRETDAAGATGFAVVPGCGAPARLLEVAGVLAAVRVVRDRDAPRPLSL